MQRRGQRAPPRPAVSSPLVGERNPRVVARARGDIAVPPGVLGLQVPPITHGAENDLDPARIVDPVASHGVNERERLQTANLKPAFWAELGSTVENRILPWLGRGPYIPH